MEEKRTIPANHFIAELAMNYDNPDISETEFRDLFREKINKIIYLPGHEEELVTECYVCTLVKPTKLLPLPDRGIPVCGECRMSLMMYIASIKLMISGSRSIGREIEKESLREQIEKLIAKHSLLSGISDELYSLTL